MREEKGKILPLPVSPMAANRSPWTCTNSLASTVQGNKGGVSACSGVKKLHTPSVTRLPHFLLLSPAQICPPLQVTSFRRTIAPPLHVCGSLSFLVLVQKCTATHISGSLVRLQKAISATKTLILADDHNNRLGQLVTLTKIHKSWNTNLEKILICIWEECTTDTLSITIISVAISVHSVILLWLEKRGIPTDGCTPPHHRKSTVQRDWDQSGSGNISVGLSHPASLWQHLTRKPYGRINKPWKIALLWKIHAQRGVWGKDLQLKVWYTRQARTLAP